MVNTEEDRRRHLRRLDDLLEALEQLNLYDIAELPPRVVKELETRGVLRPQRFSVTELIEKVWELQQPYLIVLPVERRRRRRRLERGPRLTAVS